MAKKHAGKSDSPPPDTLTEAIRRAFPSHDPNKPPLHLIERRLFEFTPEIRCLDRDDVAELLALPVRRENPPRARWGVPPFPGKGTNCEKFGDTVLGLFWSVNAAFEQDRVNPPLESNVVRILDEWPDVEVLCNSARMESKGHRVPENLRDCLDELKHKAEELRLSVESYRKWYTGKGGSCSVRQLSVDTRKLLMDLFGMVIDMPDRHGNPKSTSPENRSVADLRHSIDFRSVYWHGQEFTFSTNQAACVSQLWEAMENKTPVLSAVTITEKAGIDHERLSVVFRDHPAWGTMIVESGKGAYRLQNPITPEIRS